MTRTEATSKKARGITWVVRLAFLLVFVINVQCALQFILWPESFLGAYQLEGASGIAAMQGMGVTFLMWNATYPLYLVNPNRYRALGIIILAQQAIGLVGESFILFGLPETAHILQASITRFIAFDGAGLVIMAAAYLAHWRATKR